MEEFSKRRAALANQLQNNSVSILFSAQLQIRNGDAEYPFRQQSDFYYLSGFPEPEAVLVLSKDDKGDLLFILFNRTHDLEAEVWTGKRVGQEGACKEYNADESHDIQQIDNIMPQILANKAIIYQVMGRCTEQDQKIQIWLETAKKRLATKQRSELNKIVSAPDTIIDLAPIIHEMRLFKSIEEINNMRKAAEISAQAHLKLMQQCKPGLFEYQLEAIFNAHCLDQGCRGLAYNSIVAGGNNSCTLHYTSNDQKLMVGDLVLVDAGGEYNNYAADITRTYPINGKFTQEQKQIYNLVLQAQLAGIEQVRPGNLWDSVQNIMLEIIVKGLVELDIMRGKVKDLIHEQAYKQFYMHSSGHWLGMDVHDVGRYKTQGNWRPFEPGMVLTVEPGIYISKYNSKVDPKWHGIGVRIEDDILVTNDGHEVLSASAPKKVAEIESARN